MVSWDGLTNVFLYIQILQIYLEIVFSNTFINYINYLHINTINLIQIKLNNYIKYKIIKYFCINGLIFVLSIIQQIINLIFNIL